MGLLDPDHYLFQLARSGRRLPHLILAIILSFVMVLLAQFSGGSLAILLILLPPLLAGNLPWADPPALLALALPDTASEQTLLLVLAFGPIFLILAAWLALYEQRPLWTVGLERKGTWQNYGRGLLVGALMFMLAIGLPAAFGYIAPDDGSGQPQGLAALGGVLLLMLGWLVQGAGEEVISRGWLLPVIGARYRPLLGVIISALIFAIFHLLNPNLSLIAMLNLALFGLFTALYTLYEKGLWGVCAIHSAWNWTQGNLFGFEVSGGLSPAGALFDLREAGPDWLTGGPFGPEGGLAVTLVLSLGCLVIWRLAHKAGRPADY
jgi:membrane protease YdiL (CAAX protease family)